MIVYKIRHKETGLFYVPQSEPNLTKDGKVYESFQKVKNAAKRIEYYLTPAGAELKRKNIPGKHSIKVVNFNDDFEVLEYIMKDYRVVSV